MGIIDKHCLVYAKKGGLPKIISICEKAFYLTREYVEQLTEVEDIDIEAVKKKLAGISTDLQDMQKEYDKQTAPYKALSQRLLEGINMGLRTQSLEEGNVYRR